MRKLVQGRLKPCTAQEILQNQNLQIQQVEVGMRKSIQGRPQSCTRQEFLCKNQIQQVDISPMVVQQTYQPFYGSNISQNQIHLTPRGEHQHFNLGRVPESYHQQQFPHPGVESLPHDADGGRLWSYLHPFRNRYNTRTVSLSNFSTVGSFSCFKGKLFSSKVLSTWENHHRRYKPHASGNLLVGFSDGNYHDPAQPSQRAGLEGYPSFRVPLPLNAPCNDTSLSPSDCAAMENRKRKKKQSNPLSKICGHTPCSSTSISSEGSFDTGASCSNLLDTADVSQVPIREILEVGEDFMMQNKRAPTGSNPGESHSNFKASHQPRSSWNVPVGFIDNYHDPAESLQHGLEGYPSFKVLLPLNAPRNDTVSSHLDRAAMENLTRKKKRSDPQSKTCADTQTPCCSTSISSEGLFDTGASCSSLLDTADVSQVPIREILEFGENFMMHNKQAPTGSNPGESHSNFNASHQPRSSWNVPVGFIDNYNDPAESLQHGLEGYPSFKVLLPLNAPRNDTVSSHLDRAATENLTRKEKRSDPRSKTCADTQTPCYSTSISSEGSFDTGASCSNLLDTADVSQVPIREILEVGEDFIMHKKRAPTVSNLGESHSKFKTNHQPRSSWNLRTGSSDKYHDPAQRMQPADLKGYLSIKVPVPLNAPRDDIVSSPLEGAATKNLKQEKKQSNSQSKICAPSNLIYTDVSQVSIKEDIRDGEDFNITSILAPTVSNPEESQSHVYKTETFLEEEGGLTQD